MLPDHRAVSNTIDADVHKDGKPHADKGEDVGKQVFIADVLFTDDPYEGVILLMVHLRKRMMYTPVLISR